MGNNLKPISIAVQAGSIRNVYGGDISNLHDQLLQWMQTISPSPLGDEYRVKLMYHINSTPRIYIVHPSPLALAKDCSELPHCYEQKEQRLCLFYPDGREWNNRMLLARTIIPWTYEWLYHYEIWLGIGEWKGGGVHGVIQKK